MLLLLPSLQTQLVGVRCEGVASRNLVARAGWKWCLSWDRAGFHPVLQLPGHSAAGEHELREGVVVRGSGKARVIRDHSALLRYAGVVTLSL